MSAGPRHEGLNPLDVERAESMASEGGRAAQEVAASPAVRPSLLPLGARRPLWFALSFGFFGALLLYGWAERHRARG